MLFTRTLSIAIALAGVTPVAAGATSPSHRDMSATYLTAGGVQGVNSGDTVLQGHTLGSVALSPRRAEHHLALQVVDKAGLPVASEVYEDLNGDGKGDVLVGAFCGRTASPLTLHHAGAPVIVYINAGRCPAGPSLPTTGTVSARFSR
jgi:hypothetical protein